MFTGIIESVGRLRDIRPNKSNLIFAVESELSHSLKVDQSLSHNGVCLTVIKVEDGFYETELITETLEKSNLGSLKIGDGINLERAMKMDARLDGHMVQGHVDTTTHILDIRDDNGSKTYSFVLAPEFRARVVEKGSICINGVSLKFIPENE